MSTTPVEPAAPVPPVPRRRRPRYVSASTFVAQLAAAMPRTWVTYTIVAANVLVFGAMVASGVSPISPDAQVVFDWGADYGPATTGGEWWRLVTCAFVHIGAIHLVLNLWCLWLAGPLAERLLGHGPFAVVYAVSAVGGSLTSIVWQPSIVSAGASGAVFGTYGALLACALRLRRTVPTTMFEHLRASAGLFVLFNVVYGMRAQVDHAAHVGGLAAGFAGTWLLVRRPADNTPRAPLARTDWRFVPALVAMLAAGAAAAVWRVDGSDVMRAERESQQMWDRTWQKLEQAEAAQRFGEALAHADAMLALSPDEPTLHGRRGHYLGSLGRHEDALRATERAIALDATDPQWHSNRAWSLAALSRHEEGVRAAQRALALEPRHVLARFNLLECLDELGRHEEMMREAQAAVAQDDGKAAAHAWHGHALARAQRYAEALAAIEKALALEPANPWALEQRSWLKERLAK